MYAIKGKKGYVFQKHAVNSWLIADCSYTKMSLFRTRKEADDVAFCLNEKPGEGPYTVVEMVPKEVKRFSWNDKKESQSGYRYVIYDPDTDAYLGRNYGSCKDLEDANLYKSIKLARQGCMGIFGNPKTMRLVPTENGTWKMMDPIPMDKIFAGLEIIQCTMEEV